jgi:hypothetical protein
MRPPAPPVFPENAEIYILRMKWQLDIDVLPSYYQIRKLKKRIEWEPAPGAKINQPSRT